MNRRDLGYKIKIARFPVAAISGRTVELQAPFKQSAAYYGTPAHRAWRKAIIARACSICEQCGRNDVRLFADHIVELEDGGDPLSLSNGQALCGSCHTTKTSAAKRQREGRDDAVRNPRSPSFPRRA
jgi:5-methylcytosine-specific restriction enzyme A